METITITFNPNSPFATSVEAFLKTVPHGVKVSKEMKPARKRRTRKERFLASLTKAAKQAEELASKPHKSYSTSEELIASIFDD
ncbi:MAG: hypothetical protein IJP44_10000 [Bacteroidales bacterium]|nr:hypothetical protein [Bacteroidales bacterium]